MPNIWTRGGAETVDIKSMKAVAEWFRQTVFQDETIRPRQARRPERLPRLLREARSLESRSVEYWQSRSMVFLHQAKLLADYEDDYVFSGRVQYYYPTYQALNDQELRGYFSWRTKLRRGELLETSLSFAFLYIYELINQIGAADPMDGYRKLQDFKDAYGRIDNAVLPYLDQWLVDYVVYYGLDPALLAGAPQVLFDQSIAVLEHSGAEPPDRVAAAVKQLAPKWLGRSKFYADHGPDMDAVTARVLARMTEHCAARCKKSLTEQYFGSPGRYQVRPFEAAVFCDPLKRRNYEYAVDEHCVYRCEKGIWSVEKRSRTPETGAKLESLVKTIDAEMRQALGYRYPVKAGLDTKWLLRIIHEEIESLLAERRAAEEKKIVIDYAQLKRIRQDASITQEKLIVEEEMDLPEEPALQECAPAPAPQPEGPSDIPLSPAELRLLQCLLYGGDTGWVQAEGHLLSVLVDGVNEKLYDTFLDSVLDDAPQVLEDYIDDLKEMIRP